MLAEKLTPGRVKIDVVRRYTYTDREQFVLRLKACDHIRWAVHQMRDRGLALIFNSEDADVMLNALDLLANQALDELTKPSILTDSTEQSST